MNEIQSIPEAEDSGPKEVYAFFGLCSYSAQVLEQGVVNLAAGLRVRGLTALTAPEASESFDRADGKTLGQLLHDVRCQVQMPDDTERRLGQALKDRNYLFHRFFVEHDVDHGSDPGRRQMIDELRAMTWRFQETDRLVDAIWIPLWESLGLTAELMKAEIGRMRDEAEHRETSG